MSKTTVVWIIIVALCAGLLFALGMELAGVE